MSLDSCVSHWSYSLVARPSNYDMSLTDKKAIKELQAILKKDYGKVVSDEEAAELGYDLLQLTRVALNAKLRMKKDASKT